MNKIIIRFNCNSNKRARSGRYLAMTVSPENSLCFHISCVFIVIPTMSSVFLILTWNRHRSHYIKDNTYLIHIQQMKQICSISPPKKGNPFFLLYIFFLWERIKKEKKNFIREKGVRGKGTKSHPPETGKNSPFHPKEERMEREERRKERRVSLPLTRRTTERNYLSFISLISSSSTE